MVSRPPSHVGHHVTRLRAGAWSEDDDVLAAEEPLEIRLVWQDASGYTQRKNIAVTMRTPGDDFELAAGFLHGEGILRRREDVVDIAYCTDEDELATVLSPDSADFQRSLRGAIRAPVHGNRAICGVHGTTPTHLSVLRQR